MRAPAPFVSVRSLRRSVAAAVLSFAAVALPASARAQTPATLHIFTGGVADGSHPVGGLVIGPDGAFYGTTTNGGSTANGTVYRLGTDGTFSLLYSFGGGLTGGEPADSLIVGSDGNFYGVAQFGGAYGGGVLFRLTLAGTETVLVDFGGEGDGYQPVGSLVLGPDGNFYGTTLYGGYYDDGTVFQYTTTGAYNDLFDFGNGYGREPVAALSVGPDGNLYGVTQFGGNYGNGTAFQITTTGSVTVLHDFLVSDGVDPQGALTLLPGSTTFYGTTSGGGANGYGTVFELTTAGTFTKLHDFTGADGNYAQAALLYASDGNFYGTTFNGGDLNGDGTLFELTPAGAFTSLSVLNSTTGENPAAPLIQGVDGMLYGTAFAGGGTGLGTVFQLAVGAPASTVHPAFFNGETPVGNGVYYLAFPNGNFFGYYSFLTNPNYIYHFDLGYEYVFDAADGQGGVYFYDFASNDFFYTSPVFPFPYLYDFDLKSVLYYYANPNLAGHYTTAPRYFYDFAAGRIITK